MSSINLAHHGTHESTRTTIQALVAKSKVIWGFSRASAEAKELCKSVHRTVSHMPMPRPELLPLAHRCKVDAPSLLIQIRRNKIYNSSQLAAVLWATTFCLKRKSLANKWAALLEAPTCMNSQCRVILQQRKASMPVSIATRRKKRKSRGSRLTCQKSTTSTFSRCKTLTRWRKKESAKTLWLRLHPHR